MNIALITDAWLPQVNGVVTTLVELVRELRERGSTVTVIEPGQFRTRPFPGYAGIELAVRPARALTQMLDALQPQAIHIATEGPLGWAARRYCLKHGLAFTTAFHTKFPEFVHAALRVPVFLGYALLRHFHKPSSGVMVPTHSVLNMLARRGFGQLRSWTHGVDLDLFTYHPTTQAHPLLAGLAGPIWLFVGRVSYEKNLEAFLNLPLAGTKVVCGVGPQEAVLKARHPQVRWLGLQSRAELARIYAAADVLVFPSRTDTFGLVILEALACGTPVAAYPVDGPLDVLGDAAGQVRGGVLHEDLRAACLAALQVPRSQARARALDFSWRYATELFAAHLVPTSSAVVTTWPSPLSAGSHN